MVLSWPAPSISEGSGLACAVVPPAHPPTFLETGGHAVPPAGAAPPAPCLGEGWGVAFDCMFVTLVSRIAGFAGTEPLQSHYTGVTSRYPVVTEPLLVATQPLPVVTEPLLVATQPLPVVTEPLRSGMAPKSLCLITALAPVPAFLGGSCPLGCSLSAPATGGFSVVSPQYIRYATGSKEEKRAVGPLHWGHHSTSVLILQVGRAGSLFRDSLGK